MYIFFKKMLMVVLYAALEVLGRLRRSRLRNINRVAILFVKPLGIGDLIMLSPAIQSIADVFPQAEIELVTWVPPIINFKIIKRVSVEDAKRKRYDLVISPTLNLRHFKYILKARYWLGYFAKAKIQSNFGARQNDYDLADGHYFRRGAQLIKSLDGEKGCLIEEKFNAKQLPYPQIITSEPKGYKENLGHSKYILLAIFSKFKDRQWPLEHIVKIMGKMMREKRFDNIVITGDGSDHDKIAAQKLSGLLKQMGIGAVVNLTGKTTLPETAFLIKNCALFFGLDSGPSHLAYFLAPKGIVIFTIVPPENRLPLIPDVLSRIVCFYPPKKSTRPIYSGLAPVNLDIAKEYINSIEPEAVENAIAKLISEV